MKLFHSGVKGPVEPFSATSLLPNVSLEVHFMRVFSHTFAHKSKPVHNISEPESLFSHSNSNNPDSAKPWRKTVGSSPLDASRPTKMSNVSVDQLAMIHNQDKETICAYKYPHQSSRWTVSSHLPFRLKKIMLLQESLSTKTSQDFISRSASPAQTRFVTWASGNLISRVNGLSPNRKQSPKRGQLRISESESLTPGYPFENSDVCAFNAQSSGIKVRDFAFEAHGVQTARVVTVVDSYKHQYSKCRAARQKPSPDLVEKLSYYEPEWLKKAERKSDDEFAFIQKNSAY